LPHCRAAGFYQCGGSKKNVCYQSAGNEATWLHCGFTVGFSHKDGFNEIRGDAF